MKITDIKGYALEVPGREYQWRKGLPGEGSIRDVFFLRILTDAGIEGHCVWHHHGKIMAQVCEDIFKTLIGDDPLEREYIWQKVWYMDRIKNMPIYAQGCLDVALWDIAGKAANMPLYRLLGAARKRIKAYASTLSYFDLDTYEDVFRESLDKGFKAFKLHVTGDPKMDVEICRLARATVGDDVALMLDVSGGYSHQEALWVGRELEKLNFYWFEEPIRDYDMYGLERLRKALDIPILVAETTHGSFFDVANHIRNNTVDMIHTDWYLKAGITGLLKTAHLCEAYGITCQVHGPGFPNLHAVMAIHNTEFFEQTVPEDTFHFLVKNPPTTVDKDGYVYPPDGPGLGMDIDWDQIEKYTVREV